MIKRVLFSAICIGVGFALIKYREQIQRATGPIEWGEKIFGTGGTFTFIAAIGSIIVILSILNMFGLLDDLTVDLLGKFF